MFDALSNFKLNKILTTLASNFTEVKNAIAGVQNTVNLGPVKSVQRGTFVANASSGGHRVSISNVNVSNSILTFSQTGHEEGISGYIASSNSIQFKWVGSGIYDSSEVRWQVTEYY